MKHPNNVIEHEGWVVKRNESHIMDIEQHPYSIETVVYRYYQTYHQHEHERNSGFYNLYRVPLHGLGYLCTDPGYYLCDCGEQVPATVLGALVLIRHSDDHAVIR